jgi:hypothetical protein
MDSEDIGVVFAPKVLFCTLGSPIKSLLENSSFLGPDALPWN